MSKCTLCLSAAKLHQDLNEQDAHTIIASTIQTGFVIGVVAQANGRITGVLCVEHVNSIKETIAAIPDDELKAKVLSALNLGLAVVK